MGKRRDIHENVIAGNRIKRKCLSWTRNCNWKVQRWYKSSDCLFYHGKKREQPQPYLCGGWRRHPNTGFDPSKLVDPSLIIYAPVRVLGNKTIVSNGDQTDTIYEGMDLRLRLNSLFEAVSLSRMHRTIHRVSPVSCTSKTENTAMQCRF